MKKKTNCYKLHKCIILIPSGSFSGSHICTGLFPVNACKLGAVTAMLQEQMCEH